MYICNLELELRMQFFPYYVTHISAKEGGLAAYLVGKRKVSTICIYVKEEKRLQSQHALLNVSVWGGLTKGEVGTPLLK